jgi:hypothetical protein
MLFFIVAGLRPAVALVVMTNHIVAFQKTIEGNGPDHFNVSFSGRKKGGDRGFAV